MRGNNMEENKMTPDNQEKVKNENTTGDVVVNKDVSTDEQSSESTEDAKKTNENIQLEEQDSSKGKKAVKKKKKGDEEFSLKREIFSWIKIFIIAVIIAFVVNNCIIMNANVPSGSMKNTILEKDRMIGLRTAYWLSDPKRGDIVIFENPDYYEKGSLASDKYFVKRVIGLPGDKVVIRDAKIYINDSKTPLEEPYLPEEWTEMNGSTEELEYNVPEGCYFVMGDNRNSSNDARYWINTYVKRDKIIAKAEFKYWSKGSIDIETFDKVTYSVDKK